MIIRMRTGIDPPFHNVMREVNGTQELVVSEVPPNVLLGPMDSRVVRLLEGAENGQEEQEL